MKHYTFEEWIEVHPQAVEDIQEEYCDECHAPEVCDTCPIRGLMRQRYEKQLAIDKEKYE